MMILCLIAKTDRQFFTPFDRVGKLILYVSDRLHTISSVVVPFLGALRVFEIRTYGMEMR
jgi:hypothetical protein